VVMKEGSRIVATGSLAGGVIKCVGVEPEFQGLALTNTIVSHLEMEAYRRNRERLFVFSRPRNRAAFEDLGFQSVGEYPEEIVLLEKPGGGLLEWAMSEGADQERSATEAANVALVMNCNPFTKGHRYLVEQASRRAEELYGSTVDESRGVVHLFVVSEDRSLFPAAHRLRMVREGTADLSNVRVHPGGPYIISSATFPTYFIRNPDDIVRTHAGLDLHIFASRIAPLFGIKRRMVGHEPYCPVTAAYNRAMKDILPTYGIELEEIHRLEQGGRAVSASTVRDLIRQERMDEVKKIVPETTWRYLGSAEARPVIERLKKEKDRRH